MPRHGAMYRFVRGKPGDAVGTDQMALTGDDYLAACERSPYRQRIGCRLGNPHAMQPVRRRGCDGRVVGADVRGQCVLVSVCRGCAMASKYRQPRGRHRQAHRFFERRNRQCVQAIPKHGLNRVFPAGIHLEFRPEFVAANLVLVEPALQLAFTTIAELGLYAADGILACPQLTELALGDIKFSAAMRTLFVSMSSCGLGLLRRLLGSFELGALALKLLIDGNQLGVLRRIQAFALLGETKLARLQLGNAFLGGGLLELRKLGFAVDRVDRLLHIGERGGRRAQRRLCQRQRSAGGIDEFFLFYVLRGSNGDRIVRLGQRLVELPGLLLCVGKARLSLRNFLRHALRTITLERELLLDTRDFGIDLVERALRRVLRVILGENVLAQSFELRRQRLHFSFFREQRSFVLAEHAHGGLTLLDGLFAPLRKQQSLAFELFFFQLAIARGNLGLAFQALHLRGQLGLDVVHTGEVFASIAEATFGLLAPLLVARDACGLFEEHAQLFRLGLDDARDHALLDHRIGAGPEAGAKEHVENVATPHRLIVDVVAGADIALHHALHRQLGVLAPLPGSTAAGVVEHQLHAGACDGLALAATVEDDVVHRFAAQRGRLAFAQHPAHGVNHVGLAAAVGADNADELTGQCNGGRVNERLEPGKFDRCKAH